MISGPGSRRPLIPLGPWATVALGYAVAYLIVTSSLPDGSGLRQGLQYLGFVPLSAGLAALFLRSARSNDARVRRGFRWYGASFAVTAAGTAIWFVQESLLGVDPTYSWANLPYLLSYPFAILGVLALRPGATGPDGRVKLALDTAITLVAGITITWLFVVEPLAGTRPGLFERFITFAYPVGDLLIFAVLAPMLLGRPRGPTDVLPWLAFGQMIYLAGDLATQLPIIETRHLGVDWPDVVYALGYVVMIGAAERGRASLVGAKLLTPPANYLPVILGLVLHVVLLWMVTKTWTPAISVLVVAAVAVTGLILIREAWTVRLNLRLTRALEAERSDARFQTAMGHLRVGVMVQSPDTRVRLANPAAIEMLGLVRTGDEYLSTADVVQEDGRPLEPGTGPVTQACATRQPVRNAVLGVRRSGCNEWTWILVDVEPRLGPDGQLEEVISSVHDITERRALEDQLRQAQRMEAVGRLAGGIAHDFNNLLTAIIGYNELVKGRLEPGSPLADDVAEIGSAARRAAGLTQQLLAFGRRQLLRPELLDVNEVIGGAERLLRRLLGEDIAILSHLSPGPGLVRVDRGQLEQVIINLAVNARDALPRGGQLEIETRTLAPGDPGLPPGVASGPAGLVLLQVTDNGLGMDETTRARAFEPFFTTKDVGKGTGLGLSTVYGIVRQSGGEVWIDSSPGRGTRVTVCLPRVEGVLPGPSAATAPSNPIRGTETILIAEDEDAIRVMLKEALHRHGYRVLEAAEPNAARRILEAATERVDLLLTDVVMPGGSGPELAAWARQRRPTLPVLFMTGYADEATLHREGVAVAGAPVVSKPFDPDAIAVLIRRTLDGRR